MVEKFIGVLRGDLTDIKYLTTQEVENPFMTNIKEARFFDAYLEAQTWIVDNGSTGYFYQIEKIFVKS